MVLLEHKGTPLKIHREKGGSLAEDSWLSLNDNCVVEMRVSFRSWSYIAKDITCETPWFNRFLGLNGQGGEQSMAAHGGGGPLPHFSCRVVFFTSFDETCKRSAWLQKPLGSRHTLRPTHLCPINFPSTSYLGPSSGNSFLSEIREGRKRKDMEKNALIASRRVICWSS